MILHLIIVTLTWLSLGDANEVSNKCLSDQLAVTKIINTLGFKIENLIESQDNYFFSPLSISVALAMVYIGARGATREQMSDALNYNTIGKNCLPNKISENFQELLTALQTENNDYSFLIANGAFIQKGYQVSHYYSSSLKKFFNSKVSFLNFAEDEEATMNKINDWVSNYTKGKIPKLLNEPLDKLTVMILLNAVYFKGLWDLPFNETLTKNGLFYRYNKTAKVVPFMIMQEAVYHYYDTEKKNHVLELDYQGTNISMVLILPTHIREFPDYDLTPEFFCEMRSKLAYEYITIMMPRFKMEYKRELSKDMIKMGMVELFSDRADLTGIRERNDLHVSLMVHKAVIEVNEKGSEAAGILGIGIDGRKNPMSSGSFLADHPFLFYIIHKETNTILFSGRVADP